jgi:hypothetical protein
MPLTENLSQLNVNGGSICNSSSEAVVIGLVRRTWCNISPYGIFTMMRCPTSPASISHASCSCARSPDHEWAVMSATPSRSAPSRIGTHSRMPLPRSSDG